MCDDLNLEILFMIWEQKCYKLKFISHPKNGRIN